MALKPISATRVASATASSTERTEISAAGIGAGGDVQVRLLEVVVEDPHPLAVEDRVLDHPVPQPDGGIHDLPPDPLCRPGP